MKIYFLYAVICVFMYSVTACNSVVSHSEMKLVESLDSSLWDHSCWISVTDAPVVSGFIDDENGRAADGASWFVTRHINDRTVVKANYMTTGLGVYEIYVNGKKIGKEILKPGFTHYAKTRRSFTYDVTELMNTNPKSENIFAAQVTPGWWADKIITPWGHDGMVGKKPAFRAIIELTYDDGTKKIIGTDTICWKAGIAGPVKHADIFDGEEYDARELPGYMTLEKLSVPGINNEFSGEIIPTNGAEIYLREDLALSPQKAYVWNDVSGRTDESYGKVLITRNYSHNDEMCVGPNETLVIDFGQNCAAIPAFEFSAHEGTKMTCLPSELLNDGNGCKQRGMDGPEGSVHRLNLRTPDSGMKLIYTFGADSGYVAYQPSFTFYGYRYLSLTASDTVRIKTIKSIPVSSITSEMCNGRITTGNEMINKLISNTEWGMLSNYLSVPTDCPQRNERLGWSADTHVFAATGTYFANTALFLRKWMRDMRDTQSLKGGFAAVAPFGQYGSTEGDMMRVGWADAGIIVPWVVWKQFADTAIINENWDAMEKFITHVNHHKYNHQELSDENANFQFADWLSYEPLESNGGGIYKDNQEEKILRPEAIDYWNYLGASYWMIDAGMMRDMAYATGRNAQKYERMVNDAKTYLQNTFLNENGTFRTDILNTMQTPALFALKNKLVEGKAKDDMITRLRDNFSRHDNCLQTGFLGTSILMPTLTENGMHDLAYELLFQRKNPSWLYSIDNGATTIWERWNSYMKDYGMGPNGMNSFNHYAYGCVGQWIWETAAGIASDSAQPGFKHIIMRPIPDKRLGFVKAEYDSAAGLITSEWKYDSTGRWIWDFTIPEGATALVTIPGNDTPSEYSSGSYHIEI